jgi:hypothetical protein
MPYSRPFIKVRALGVFGATAAAPYEKWSSGFNLSSLGGGSVDPASLLTFLGNVSNHISTFHASTAIKSGSSTWLTQLTAAYIGTDGLYVLGALQPTTVYTYGSPVAGSTLQVHPLGTSCVLSLRSLRLRGPASHGRMYWPCLGLPATNTDATIALATTTLIATAAKTMLDGVNSVAASSFGTGGKVSLVSRAGAGAEAIVTSIMVDQKFDHMESRERSIASSYATATTAAAAAALDERNEELRRLYDQYDNQFEDN